jgi:hypothetical protein
MRKIRTVVLCVIVLVELAVAGKIKADFDKDADFSSYRRYAWGNNLEASSGAGKLTVLGAIEQEMEKRGFQKTDVEHADIIIRYQVATDTDLNLNASVDPTYAAVGGIPVNGATVWYSGLGAVSTARYLKKGTLAIDVFDVRQHKLVWSVSATDTIHENTTKAIKQVSKVVSEMFERYPAKVQN